MERCGSPVVKLTVTSAKAVLKIKNNTRTKVLKCTVDHILFMSAVVDEHKEQLIKLTRAEIYI